MVGGGLGGVVSGATCVASGGGAGVQRMARATTTTMPTPASNARINPHHTRLRRSARAARFPQLDRGRHAMAGAGAGSTVRDEPPLDWTTVAYPRARNSRARLGCSRRSPWRRSGSLASRDSRRSARRSSSLISTRRPPEVWALIAVIRYPTSRGCSRATTQSTRSIAGPGPVTASPSSARRDPPAPGGAPRSRRAAACARRPRSGCACSSRTRAGARSDP